ncbi:DUF6092 family protein [Actinomadura yumaensis]|uniref:DUF6092 family protein n=1 Tax=Actinomadura yumaensis TaxID=111807 RepID=A0ABW2CES6_9ACTN
MTATPDPTRRDTELARLAAYLLASSRSLLDDPPDYGPYRLMDAARRTLTLLEADGPANAHYTSVRTRIDDTLRTKTPIDPAALLDTLCLHMAHGLKAANPDNHPTTTPANSTPPSQQPTARTQPSPDNPR